MKNNHTWFQVHQLDNSSWVIDDNGHSLIYLVTGKQSALLIDTGWGVGNLSGLVSNLTSLPLTVVNTHGHPDHTFGNGTFNKIAITQADLFMVQNPIAAETRTSIKENLLAERPSQEITLNDWNPKPAATFDLLNDGDTFDLGERSLQVITTPSHTQGCICLLDRSRHWLFSGDMILPWPVWAQLDESTPLSEYHQSLQKLQGLRSEFNTLLPGHGDARAVPFPLTLLDQLTNGIARILSGELNGQPEQTFAGDGLKCQFGMTGIIYRPDKL